MFENIRENWRTRMNANFPVLSCCYSKSKWSLLTGSRSYSQVVFLRTEARSHSHKKSLLCRSSNVIVVGSISRLAHDNVLYHSPSGLASGGRSWEHLSENGRFSST
jgi:hypothetical protein